MIEGLSQINISPDTELWRSIDNMYTNSDTHVQRIP